MPVINMFTFRDKIVMLKSSHNVDVIMNILVKLVVGLVVAVFAVVVLFVMFITPVGTKTGRVTEPEITEVTTTTTTTTTTIPEEVKSVGLTISPRDIRIEAGQTDFVDIIITNEMSSNDVFSRSIWPSTTSLGITPRFERYYVTNFDIEAEHIETEKLYFTVDADASEIITTFRVTVESTTHPGVNDTEDVNVRVLSPLQEGLCIAITESVCSSNSVTVYVRNCGREYTNEILVDVEGFQCTIQALAPRNGGHCSTVGRPSTGYHSIRASTMKGSIGASSKGSAYCP